jgi:hypothetical protein
LLLRTRSSSKRTEGGVGATPLLGVALLACTSGGANNAEPGTDADAGADSALACPSGCAGIVRPNALCVVSVDAQLVDATGAGAPGEALTVCGTNLCSLPVETDPRGFAHFSLCLNLVEPALKFLGGATHVSFAAAVTHATETFPPITLVALPAQGSPIPTGGGSATSGPVTLHFAAGSVTFDPTGPTDPSSREFRAASIAPGMAPPGLDPTVGVRAVWGLAPANAMLTPAATMTVPNPDASWTPGTTVDFFANGAEASATAPLPYGGWGHIGTGTVSADGKTITTDTGAGNGLPMLGIVAVAPHP